MIVNVTVHTLYRRKSQPHMNVTRQINHPEIIADETQVMITQAVRAATVQARRKMVIGESLCDYQFILTFEPVQRREV